jgi:hypothetical protein
MTGSRTNRDTVCFDGIVVIVDGLRDHQILQQEVGGDKTTTEVIVLASGLNFLPLAQRGQARRKPLYAISAGVEWFWRDCALFRLLIKRHCHVIMQLLPNVRKSRTSGMRYVTRVVCWADSGDEGMWGAIAACTEDNFLLWQRTCLQRWVRSGIVGYNFVNKGGCEDNDVLTLGDCMC